VFWKEVYRNLLFFSFDIANNYLQYGFTHWKRVFCILSLYESRNFSPSLSVCLMLTPQSFLDVIYNKVLRRESGFPKRWAELYNLNLELQFWEKVNFNQKVKIIFNKGYKFKKIWLQLWIQNTNIQSCCWVLHKVQAIFSSNARLIGFDLMGFF
jgi:hypothetical protein